MLVFDTVWFDHSGTTCNAQIYFPPRPQLTHITCRPGRCSCFIDWRGGPAVPLLSALRIKQTLHSRHDSLIEFPHSHGLTAAPIHQRRYISQRQLHSLNPSEEKRKRATFFDQHHSSSASQCVCYRWSFLSASAHWHNEGTTVSKRTPGSWMLPNTPSRRAGMYAHKHFKYLWIVFSFISLFSSCPLFFLFRFVVVSAVSTKSQQTPFRSL